MDDGGRPAFGTIAVQDPSHLAAEAARRTHAAIEDAVRTRGTARVILSGGSTPRETYRLLSDALRGTDISRIDWYFGDERWVPVDDPQSNEGMARETLLGPIGAPESTIHSWSPGQGDPVACAARYAAVVLPADIVLLGMGADGHTASLFPGSTAQFPGGVTAPVGPALSGAAAAVPGEPPRGWRLTLCPDILDTCRVVLFLVAGADKAPALRRALSGDPGTPAAWIRGGATWFIATRDALGPEHADFGPRVVRA